MNIRRLLMLKLLGAVAAAPDVAPTLAYVTALSTGASGATRAPDFSPAVLMQGDLLRVKCISRATGTNSTTPPAGQGWVLNGSHRGSSFTFDIYEKYWGVGDTDSNTPIFTFQTGGTTIAAYGEIWRGAKYPAAVSQVTAPLAGTLAAMPSPLVALPVVLPGKTIVWDVASTDDNSIGSPSRGALGAGGASYNFNANGSVAMAYEADVDASVVSCTLNQTANGPDASRFFTSVIDGKPVIDDGITITQFSTLSYCRANTNGTGWRSGVVTDPIVRSGFVYKYAATIETDASIRFVCYRRPENDPDGWVLFASHNSGVIPDPAGITFWPADNHHGITLGVSKLGKPQAWVRAHRIEAAMLHWQGTGPGDVTCDVWVEGVPRIELSYPQQWNMADGTSCFSGRVGAPGTDAQQCMYEQNAAEDGWTLITNAIMNFTNGTGDDESPYMQRIVPDLTRDEIHVSWCWARGNVTNTYHGILYVKGRRTGVATWEWEAMNGTPITLPVLDTTAACIVDPVGENLGVGVHNGMGFDPATGRPLIPYRKAAGSTAGSGTNYMLATWSGSAWVLNTVCLAHPTWNFIDAPPASERGVCRAPDVLKVGSALWYFYTTDIDLSTSGVPCLMRRISTDGGATWGAATRLVDQPFYQQSSRYDQNGWQVFGNLSFLLALVDTQTDGVWTLPLQANASIVDIATP